MSKTVMQEAMKALTPREQEAVRKLWKEEKRILREANRMRRKHIFYV